MQDKVNKTIQGLSLTLLILPLKRKIKTCQYILEESNQLWVPMEKHWRLNERHYGALQGLNKYRRLKSMVKNRYTFGGEVIIFRLRDGFEQGKNLSPDRAYAMLDEKLVPLTENLEIN